MLFLPKILSATVLFIVFKYMLENGVPELMDKVFGKEIHSLIGGSVSNSAKFNWYMIFSIWSGFGTGVLVYTSTMSGIPQEVVESAQLDGITPLKELTHITMPMIYPTFTTFMVVNFATIFTNEMSLFLFEGYIGLGQVDATNSSRFTIGYYLFGGAQSAQSHHEFKTFTYLSTFGLILSMIAIPTTFIFKRLLEKCGPSFE